MYNNRLVLFRKAPNRVRSRDRRFYRRSFLCKKFPRISMGTKIKMQNTKSMNTNSEFLRRHADATIRRVNRKSRLAWDYQLPERYDIIDRANQRGFFVKIGNRLLKAHIGGAKLEFPMVSTKEGHSCEVSWALAERLANGISNTVIF